MARRWTDEERAVRDAELMAKRARTAETRAANAEKKRLNRERIDNNKRERAEKKAVASREAWLRKLKRTNDKADRLQGVYYAMLGIYYAAKANIKCGRINYQVYGRLIGTHIFELNPHFMGWKSEAFLIAKNTHKECYDKTLSPTDEHVYPRQFDGEFLLCHMLTMDGMTFNMFLDYASIFTQVAHVLPSENDALIQHQKSHKFISPIDAYTKAEIAVIDSGTGQTFRSLEDVAPQKVLHAYFGRRSHA